MSRPTDHDMRPGLLPHPNPTCPMCGEKVTGFVCGASPRSIDSVKAIQAVLLAAHNRLVHHVRWPNPCESCGGSGEIEWGSDDGLSTFGETCSACDGSGRTPQETP